MSADEISPRDAAARRRHVRYSDGKPGVRGHIGQRYTRNATCCECQRLMTQQARERIRRFLRGGAA